MAEDWAINVKKYVPDADDAVIAKIVRYCGIALTKRDSSLVSFSDPKETARVRNNYCKKKLGLTHSDEELDAMIARVGERMSDDTTRNRVTVYYLLADACGKLSIFGGTGGGAAAIPAAAAAGAAGLMSAAPAAAASDGASTPVAAPVVGDDDNASRPAPAAVAAANAAGGSGVSAGFALAVIGGLAAIVIGTATVGSLIGDRQKKTVEAPLSPPAVGTIAAPVVAAPAAAAPQGAAVVAQEVAGKPMASVYFDTGKSAIAPNFAEATAAIKAWIAANPGDRLAVSGFNDPTGNAALNAELSKNRAQAVAAELAKTGVPADRIDLVKPPETTDTNIDAAQARRVDIMVTGG